MERFILGLDRALRTLTGQQRAARPSPGADAPNSTVAGGLTDTQRRHAAGLMRVNHCGEVCAQALYDGQAVTARDPKVLAMLQAAGAEEVDHLVWCEERLTELDTRPSLLNPLFYAASWSLGALAGLLGDKAGLAFVEATEDQVVQHLDQHLRELPEEDVASRAIVTQMRDDEARHGQAALAAGGGRFSPLQKRLMAGFARVMTATTYRI